MVGQWRETGWRAAVAFCGLLNVAALLAWVMGLGAFHVWFLLTGLPAALFLAVTAAVLARRPERDPYLRRAIVAGTMGGLLGTIGYDVFRVPFEILGGLRLMAPVDSYGVLLLDAGASSSTTGFAGWSFHFANGIGFGIAYAVVALGRRWPWALLWAFVLETATILTPFADSYGLRGKWGLIAIAYAAHVAYGSALGVVVQRAADWDLERPTPVPAWSVVAVLIVVLVAWLRPTGSVPARPATTVVGGEFQREWLRTTPDQCASLRNLDDRAYELTRGDRLDPGATGELCVAGTGVHRVRLTGDAYSGGFVIVDDA